MMLSLNNDRDTLSDQPGSDMGPELLGAKISVSRFKHFTFDTLLVMEIHAEYSYDEDWVYDGFHPWGYSSTDQYNRDEAQAALNLDSPHLKKVESFLIRLIGYLVFTILGKRV